MPLSLMTTSIEIDILSDDGGICCHKVVALIWQHKKNSDVLQDIIDILRFVEYPPFESPIAMKLTISLV